MERVSIHLGPASFSNRLGFVIFRLSPSDLHLLSVRAWIGLKILLFTHGLVPNYWCDLLIFNSSSYNLRLLSSVILSTPAV